LLFIYVLGLRYLRERDVNDIANKWQINQQKFTQ